MSIRLKGHSLIKSVHDKRIVIVTADLVSYDPAVIKIQDGAQIYLMVFCADVILELSTSVSHAVTRKPKKSRLKCMVGIFADEAITGTNVNKREQFLEMIDRCMAGEIDMILTKSISRFARNTLDTLNYVRMLKDKNISVIFEKENIDTLTMNGELMLTILSSLAQQEVESLSSNVKMGIAMKMQRGEMVGFNGCLGYDYHPEDKSLTVKADYSQHQQAGVKEKSINRTACGWYN